MKSECKVHGFVDHYTRTDHNGLRCKPCNVIKVAEHRRRKKQWCIDYLGGECKQCCYSKCTAALEFHHRDPTQKDFQFSKYQKSSYDKLAKELDKCDLLCANCHRETHQLVA